MPTGPVDRDELLARVPLEKLLTHLSGPPQRGRWHCPDVEHPDQHPSVTVTVAGDGTPRWRCWSGGHRGTAIDAVIAARRVGVRDAMRWLADHYDTLPPSPFQAPLRVPAALPGRPDRAVTHYVNRAEVLLWTPVGEPQRRWLHERGLGDDVLHANRVGADPGRLAVLPRPGGFPRCGPAVVFPALDPAGHVTYFQARYLDPPPGRGKYDNPARHHASNPRLAWTRPVGGSRTEQASAALVVCEGIPDALVVADTGVAAVGVLGSSYPDRTLADTLAACAAGRPLVVCFDGDTAGKAGAARLCALLADREVIHRVLIPPNGADVSDWARTDPDWTEHLATTISAVTSPPAHTPVLAPEMRFGLGLPSL